ncbi:MAG: ribonuclease T, partial [Methyloceanibacter sp.]
MVLALVVLLAIGLVTRKERDKDEGQPKPFDYYALVLGWSPSYCAAEGKQRRDRQCETPHGFVLHGLWP